MSESYVIAYNEYAWFVSVLNIFTEHIKIILEYIFHFFCISYQTLKITHSLWSCIKSLSNCSEFSTHKVVYSVDLTKINFFSFLLTPAKRNNFLLMAAGSKTLLFGCRVFGIIWTAIRAIRQRCAMGVQEFWTGVF